MKKRRNLGHVSHFHFLAEQTGVSEAELPSILPGILEGLGISHGSQINSGSVYITEAGSGLFLIGTDSEGNTRTFAFGVTGSLLHLTPTGSS
jgi:hypothetical protein